MTPRLFLQIVGLEARTRLSYRVDFWITAVATIVIELGLYYFICQALFKHANNTLAGYSLDALLLYYLAAILIAKIVRGTEFDGAISGDIYDGGLNRYLLFPTSYLPFKLAQQVGALVPILVQTIVLGVIVVGFFELPTDVQPTAATVVMATVAVAMASLLYFLMGCPLHAVAFWADNVWSLTVALRLGSQLLGGLLFPLALFPARARAIVDLLPFRFLFAFPVDTLLGRIGLSEWLLGVVITGGWCVLFALLGRAVFRRGELQYSGVGI